MDSPGGADDADRDDSADEGWCRRWRDAISARADGEDPGLDPRLVATHLARCADCRAFAAAVVASPPIAVTPGAAVADLSRPIARLAAAADRARASVVVRGLLVVVAVEIIALSLPALVLGDQADTARHAARHLGAFTVAYGVGLLVVAARPARARTMLPVATVLAGALVCGAVVDLVQGRVPIVDEVLHLPELVSVLLVWLLATPARYRPPAVTGGGPAGLHAVPGPGEGRAPG